MTCARESRGVSVRTQIRRVAPSVGHLKKTTGRGVFESPPNGVASRRAARRRIVGRTLNGLYFFATASMSSMIFLLIVSGPAAHAGRERESGDAFRVFA